MQDPWVMSAKAVTNAKYCKKHESRETGTIREKDKKFARDYLKYIVKHKNRKRGKRMIQKIIDWQRRGGGSINWGTTSTTSTGQEVCRFSLKTKQLNFDP